MQVAGRYRLGELLGRGGMGEVWRGTDEVLGRQVAVKLLLPEGGDESSAARFRLEAQTAARLNHPQVVAVYDFGEWDGRFYLVMELVDGVSLDREVAARGPLAPERVARIAAQAAGGLAAAHGQGVVHRDIKPANLMLAPNDTVKIGDFGIARFVDATSAGLTRAGQIVGTSTYLAPERALGRLAGPESDVYALGCVLYQLLTGRPPFWSENPTALLYMHVDDAPVPPSRHNPGIPPALEQFVLRMLAKAPEERPSAQETAEWFAGREWSGGRQRAAPPVRPLPPEQPMAPPVPAPMPAYAPASVRPTPPSGPPQSPRPPQPPRSARSARPPKRRKTLIGVIAGIVAFVVAALIGSSLFSSGDKSGTGGGTGGGTGSVAPPALPDPMSSATPPTSTAPKQKPRKHHKPPHSLPPG
ncbi:serine/threonine-protein kinase [Streptomyces morookaense]|uniref:non-specific serine/threonine protein kinase n=1 Tax=Streptomyces morookaense TaxID=1970 RepID=A0A7Y7EA89_STRMO|nr:serine/threonine-protein kinase [Streptomyces morookaense]NVK81843.1 serine/threonine protein kinase [Streptomyces morookaense]